MEAQGRKLASLRSLYLDLPPSCVEFCPAHPDYLVVGTYNLQKEELAVAEELTQETVKKPQSRNGSLVVFKIVENTDVILHVQTFSYPSALLDLHFHPHQEKHEVLATVSSTGTLSFFRLVPGQSPSSPLAELASHKPLGDDESVLFLSCAWHPSLSNLLAITTSDCQVHILRVDNSWSAHRASTSPIITHTLEAWTVAFSPFLVEPSGTTDGQVQESSSGLTLYSGGDDSKLLSTSCFYHKDMSKAVEEGDEGQCITMPYPTITAKGHMAGVTAILPLSVTLSGGAGIVVTGSYDDNLRLYSIHSQLAGIMPLPPKLLAEENLGGGVWRLKLIKLQQPDKDSFSLSMDWTALLLVSCMHAGSRLIKISGDYGGACQIEILGRFEEHKSMNYGSDFQPGTGLDSRPLRCVSTSFYDRLLCLWEI